MQVAFTTAFSAALTAILRPLTFRGQALTGHFLLALTSKAQSLVMPWTQTISSTHSFALLTARPTPLSVQAPAIPAPRQVVTVMRLPPSILEALAWETSWITAATLSDTV